MLRKHIFQTVICGVLLFVGAIACKPPTPPPGGHSHGPHEDHSDHGHGEEESIAIPITVWANGYEIFAEHGPVVAGKPAEFITHVSRIDTGQHHPAGSIKFVVSNAAGDSFSHPQGSPARDGIYLPRITFPKAGDWELTVRIPVNGQAVAVPLGSVHVFANEAAAEEMPEPETPDGISFLKEQQWKHPTRVRPAEHRSLTRRVTAPGEVHARPGNRGAITTPIGGRMLPPENGTLPTIGQTLKAGEVVARIQPVFSEITTRLVEARAAIERALIQVADTRKTHDRIALLAKEGAKSQRELQAAERELKLAESNLAAARSLESAYASANAGLLSGDTDQAPTIALTAPVDGTVSRVGSFASGEFVAEGTSLLWTLDADVVHLHAHVPEAMSSRLTSIAGAGALFPGSPRRSLPVLNDKLGKLLAVGPEVDVATRTLPVVIETPNPRQQFHVGQQLTLQLHTGKVEDALAIPLSALIEEEGLTTAYVQVAGETFQKRVLKLGIRADQWVQVLSGIEPGEMVVVENAYAIRLASVAGGAVPHGHHH